MPVVSLAIINSPRRSTEHSGTVRHIVQHGCAGTDDAPMADPNIRDDDCAGGNEGPCSADDTSRQNGSRCDVTIRANATVVIDLRARIENNVRAEQHTRTNDGARGDKATNADLRRGRNDCRGMSEGEQVATALTDVLTQAFAYVGRCDGDMECQVWCCEPRNFVVGPKHHHGACYTADRLTRIEDANYRVAAESRRLGYHGEVRARTDENYALHALSTTVSPSGSGLA